jgi:hypothetical protein
MISDLKITVADDGTRMMKWGRVTYAVTDWRKDAGAYRCTITPPEFSPSALRIEPKAGILWSGTTPMKLLDWRVEGRTATGRTDDGGGWELEAADDAAAPGGNVGR